MYKEINKKQDMELADEIYKYFSDKGVVVTKEDYVFICKKIRDFTTFVILVYLTIFFMLTTSVWLLISLVLILK